MPDANSKKPEMIVRAVGLVMMLVLCILGVYAKQNVDLQNERVHEIRQEIVNMRNRFDTFLTTDRQVHSLLIERISSTETCLDILSKKVEKMEE